MERFVSPSGSDGASGTSLDFAWATLAYAATEVGDGDTLWVAPGRYGATSLDVFNANLNNFTLAAIDENAGFTTSHAHQINQVAWVLHAANCWKATLATGLTILAVHKLWMLILDASGRPMSELLGVASAPNCVATDNSWYYNSATGDLYCNFAGDNPTTNDLYASYPVEYVRSYSQSLIWITGSGNRIIAGRAENIRDSSGGPYGIRTSGMNNTIQGCVTRNMAWHAYGHVSSGDISGCVVEDCEAWGQGTTTAASMIVNYGGFTNFSGNEVRRCRIHNYVPLDTAGVPITTLAGIVGCHQHTDTVALVDGITFRRVEQWFYENTGNAFTGNDTNPANIPADGSADELDPDAYPIRYIDCKVNDGHAWGFSMGASLNRCIGLLTKRQTAGTPNFQTAGFTNAHKMAFFASHMAANLYTSSGFRTFFNLQRGTAGVSGESRIVSLNSNFVDVSGDVGEAAPTWPRLFTWTGASNTGSVLMLGTAIKGNPTKGISLSVNQSNTQAAAAAFTFTKCWYENIDPIAALYGTPGLANFTDFKTAKDPSGVSASAGFSDPELGAAVPAGVGLLSQKLTQTDHVETGINGLPYNSRVGAWQDGKTGSPGLWNGINIGIV